MRRAVHSLAQFVLLFLLHHNPSSFSLARAEGDDSSFANLSFTLANALCRASVRDSPEAPNLALKVSIPLETNSRYSPTPLQPFSPALVRAAALG
jgi:hypothetical protein